MKCVCLRKQPHHGRHTSQQARRHQLPGGCRCANAGVCSGVACASRSTVARPAPPVVAPPAAVPAVPPEPGGAGRTLDAEAAAAAGKCVGGGWRLLSAAAAASGLSCGCCAGLTLCAGSWVSDLKRLPAGAGLVSTMSCDEAQESSELRHGMSDWYLQHRSHITHDVKHIL